MLKLEGVEEGLEAASGGERGLAELPGVLYGRSAESVRAGEV